ncbi:MAG: mechanosensitive ion channel family protein [Bacilli bacterium]|nr:mechanosensitive ion channel family protein [Bacilli bacterium]
MIDFIKSEKFILPIVYLVIGIILYNIVRFIINKIMKNKYVDKRKKTIISLIKNILKYIIYTFVILSILSVYGVDTTGIIASLGIAGLVIGLALQDIIADFVAGIFILFDDRYTIGDTIEINGFKGEVIGFGLMSTKIKNSSGDVLILANSSFKEIKNFSRHNNNLVITLDVSYNTDIDKLEMVLESLREDVKNMNNVCGDYKLLGINEFSSSSIKYLVTIECKANCQYQIKRDYLKLVKNTFDKNKIEIPYNKLDINVRGKDE